MNRAEATLPALSAPSYVPLMSSATVKRPTPAAAPAYKTSFLLGLVGRFVELPDWNLLPEPSGRRIADWLGAALDKELRHVVHVQCAGLVETRRKTVDDIEVFMLENRLEGHLECCMFVKAMLGCIKERFNSSSLKVRQGKKREAVWSKRSGKTKISELARFRTKLTSCTCGFLPSAAADRR